jgi:hypothetical protein
LEETARENFIKRKERELARAKLQKSKAEARILKIEAELEDSEEAFSRYLRTQRKNQKFKNSKVPPGPARSHAEQGGDDDWF